MVEEGTARDRLVAAYALRATGDADLTTFKDYLDQYSKELIEAAVADVLAYLGMGDGVEVEVVHLTEEQTDKLKASGMLDEYLMGRDKEDCDG
jgi:predicted TPR repeat methyltransferase